MSTILKVEALRVAIGALTPLSSVSFSLEKGETLGLVGESGSGKSLTAMAIMGLLPLIGGRITGGSVVFDGSDLTALPEPAYRKLRGGRIGLITQNPMTSLDPLKKVGSQIDVVARLHLGLDKSAARNRTVELLGELRIPEPASIYHLYPHQLSGGMKQRIVIAMALAADPDLLIADEPTTALDVTVQAQIIRLLSDLIRDRGLSMVLITHDMSVVAQACDKVVVMYAGTAVEYGTVAAIFDDPRHPYTKALIGCIPRGLAGAQRLKGIEGTVPSVAHYPQGCRFHPRCPRAEAICAAVSPPFIASRDGAAACHFAGAVG
ncbi:peptide/nickel transport system ATP-binding protein/oligopeptide transport system ATP-binding protein [Mesorhizobium loti]|uniref:Peptide/nickel transport system ATP-binding protein/oligopeptide transport system ATP-binding protein n=1 Tax=Rhizobium loti TaxID=381 RepID=A0A8E2WDK9_RHILI|nr:ABC transporter ATP-binding protein [Mesorhizobium loti]PWJ92268.1 peptide/nickel transport system ATP-binding protein/oligopeptide transport system ATP-binding protein [Mesorhizobium loti]